MALINIATLHKQIMQMLPSIDPPGGIELLSYKRNRTIALLVKDSSTFLLKEDGYLQQDVVSNRDTLPRLLKEMIKREFPRSRKVRLYKCYDPVELERTHQKI
ncbi:hypothetical protein [Desulfogranum japonicum]|uniref:hypothetical protein n=1 Tax=Desulfogranum japonicum TaxID=231447 RepID=UPI00041F62BA|nr:hypothetical protein [Desulfogranum japonicum]